MKLPIGKPEGESGDQIDFTPVPNVRRPKTSYLGRRLGIYTTRYPALVVIAFLCQLFALVLLAICIVAFGTICHYGPTPDDALGLTMLIIVGIFGPLFWYGVGEMIYLCINVAADIRETREHLTKKQD